MPKCLCFVCLLLASFHSCIQNKQSHDGEKVTSENVTSCLEHVRDLEIYSPSSETTIGRNVTLECISQTGCLPINYTLFLNTTKMLHDIIKTKMEEKVVFNITVNSISDMGEYKCRARNRFNNEYKYSPGFNFTLRDQPEDVISCSDPVRDLDIYSPFSETVLGGNVTLECKSAARCLPINYTLFLKRDKALRHMIKNKEEERVVFNFTINSINELGEYKCRARNRFNDPGKSKYSRGFNFTLREAEEEKENNKLVVFIVAPLLLLLLMIVIAVSIPLMILPWCKAKNQNSVSTSTHYIPAGYLSSETCAIYDDVAHRKDDEVEYCSVNIVTMKRDCTKGIFTEDTTVNYAEIVIKR